MITERADMVGMENRQRASDIYIQVSNDAEVSQELQQVRKYLLPPFIPICLTSLQWLLTFPRASAIMHVGHTE